MKSAKRILSVCLALLLALSLLPPAALPARGASVSQTGDCGVNLTWTLYDDGSLTIEGSGDMYNYNLVRAPWGTSVKTVTIGNGVTSIGSYAFYECSKLTSVTIGNGVTSIGGRAFRGCTGLTSVTIPDSVTGIDDSAFYGCTGLTSITIPGSVTSIGEYAFSGCTGLTSVAIGNGVTMIGQSAFNGCTGLKGVYITDLAAWCNIKFGDNPLFYAHTLYINGEKAENITIPDSVTSIGGRAFRGCTGLTSVTIGNGVKSIGDHAFSLCSGLTSVTIPDSVTSIGEYAFSGCTGLTSVTIPDSVTSIGYGAFEGCTGLTSITIPGSVTSIGYRAFYGCTGLTSVTIPDSVTSIGDSAFYDCTGLTSVTIPDSVTSIGQYSFYGCTGLTSVTIPDSVTSIGGSAFYGCTGLTSVTIPGSVTRIDHRAFYGCTGLTSVTIPDSVTSIGVCAFYDCTGLTSVTIGNGVKSIGEDAFFRCTELRDVYYHVSVEQWKSISVGVGNDCLKNAAFHLHGPEFRTEEISAPTCTETGNGTRVCLYCGYEENVILSALSHDWAEPVYEWSEDYAVCTATVTCKRDASHKESESAESVCVSTKEPTCTENGEKVYTAGFLNKLFWGQTQKVTLPSPGGHDFSRLIADAAHLAAPATCLTPARYYYTCIRCETVDSSVSVAVGEPDTVNGHDWSAWKTVKDPTCAEGLMYRACSGCGESETQTIKPIFDHDWGEWTPVPGEPGKEQRVCKNDPSHVETRGIALYATGDVDGSGEIEPGDARLALRISLGLMTDGSTVMTDDMVARADADGKDGVQPADARLILRKSLGITDPEWAG